MLYPNPYRCAKCFGIFGKCGCRESILKKIITKMKKGPSKTNRRDYD